ncbi:MAG: Ig-like domain-containing protein [Bacteroidaceae bacterium]|nr:Ig-like domain-containing protein [Bacteroidaceae bacterium]
MKKICLLCLMLCISLWANAQATSLTVDNQTPGWLSSKIIYGDQLTVRDLKVTGYINNTDLKFIGTLIQLYSLDGELDLADCHVVSETSGGNHNELKSLGLAKMDSIRVYRIPKSITTAENIVNNLYVDTLYFNCRLKYINQKCLWSGKVDIGHLDISENVDSIPDEALCRAPETGYTTKIKSVKFSPKVRYIGTAAFSKSGLSSCNFNDLDSLEFLGNAKYGNKFVGNDSDYYHTFDLCTPDTIIIPQTLTSYPLTAFIYKKGCHIFIGDSPITLNGGYNSYSIYSASGEGLTFHINQMTPPQITDWRFATKWFEGATVYVPKGAKSAYENSGWSSTNIIEVNPVEKITLNKHEITINKDEQGFLSVAITPLDADDQSLKWTSSDIEIAKVDEKGTITALKPGEAWIKVVSVDNPEATDSCKVKVLQPVTGIELSNSTYVLESIGDSGQITASVHPEDASNKEVNWKSSDESICVVSNGTIVAVGYGTAVVIATTVDGGFMDVCVVTVEDNTPVSGIDADVQGYKVFDMKGVQRSRLVKGLNIIRFSDGTTKKVMIK